MPFPLTKYTLVNEGTPEEDIEEEYGKILKKDLIGATIKEVYTEGKPRGSNTSDILLSLKDGRVIHIIQKFDGEGFEFCIWDTDQPGGRS